MNKLLMEENDRLQKQVAHLVYENSYFRQQTQNVKSFYPRIPVFLMNLFVVIFLSLVNGIFL